MLQQVSLAQRQNLLSTAGSAFNSDGDMIAEITQVIFGGKNGAATSVGGAITGTAFQYNDATLFNSGPAIAAYFQSNGAQQAIQQSGLDYIVISHSDRINSSDLPGNLAQVTGNSAVPTVFFNPQNVTIISPNVQPIRDPSRSSYGGAYPILSTSPGVEVIPTQTFIRLLTGGGG